MNLVLISLGKDIVTWASKLRVSWGGEKNSVL